MHVLRKLREENLCLSRIYTSITVTVCNMRYTQVSKMALKWSKMLYLFNLYHQFLLLFYKHQENLRGITLWIVFSHIIHALLYKCKSSFGVVHNLCFDIKKNCCCFYAEIIVCLYINTKPCVWLHVKSHRNRIDYWCRTENESLPNVISNFKKKKKKLRPVLFIRRIDLSA